MSLLPIDKPPDVIKFPVFTKAAQEHRPQLIRSTLERSLGAFNDESNVEIQPLGTDLVTLVTSKIGIFFRYLQIFTAAASIFTTVPGRN